jgi:hypothetical protein
MSEDEVKKLSRGDKKAVRAEGKVGIGFSGSSRIDKTPELVIDEAIERKDWFSAFSNAVSYFEFWAYIWLWRYCRKENIHIEKIIKGLNVRELNIILYLLKFTDSNIFNKMKKTISERNRYVHPEKAKQMLGYRHKEKKEEKEKALRILEDAKYCIKKVREGAISFK